MERRHTNIIDTSFQNILKYSLFAMMLPLLKMKLGVLSIIFLYLGIKSCAASESAAEGPTVCVIGCGPGGMFFLHAISERRRMMEATGDNEGLRRLPASVTVFEKSSAPGGVWKAERNFETDHDHDAVQGRETYPQHSSLKTPNPDSCDFAFPSTNEPNEVSGNMYEALWTNGPKERIEFVDYTFQDHFGKDVPLPTYLPRQVILEYITSRVTRNNPDLFDDVRYNTQVISVVYDEERAKFLVTAKNHDNQMIQTSEFDKCVWAAGNEGMKHIPEDVDLVLKNGGYLGDTIHSSEVGRIDFDSAVRGKKVLMVGDSFSAEDLTLVAIKADAAKVYILSRLGKGIVNLSPSWPGNKVELLRGFMLTGVTKTGLGLRFKESRYIHGSDLDKHYVVQDGKIIEEDISLVVYCTGYDQNLNMLEDSLRPPSADDGFGDIPEGWMMKHNYLSDDLGVIPLSHHIKFYGTIPGIYRGLLISNPSIMFFVEQFEAPLFEIDVQAWLFVAYIIGSTEIPSRDEMKKHNSKQTMNELDVPETRKVMDSNYFLAWENLGHNHWSKNFTNPRGLSILEEYFTYYLRIMAQKMKDAQYPDDIGSLEKLNAKGEAIVKLDLESVLHRTSIPTDGPQVEWKTFRDADPSGIKSIHTGAEAAQLNSRWLHLENSAYDHLLQK